MQLDLSSKSACIFGLPDSGKSTLANFILNRLGASALVYDTLHEYPGEPFDSYEPKGTYDVAELEGVIRKVMASRKYSMFVLDEANRFCPSKPSPLPQAVADLNDFRAHYGLGCIFISRRPVQLNQDLTELAHFLFIFQLPGKNDTDYLNSVSKGLGDAVFNLPKWHFIVVYPDRHYEVFNPVPRDFATNKLIKPRSIETETEDARIPT
jgi:hypothetical protein